MQIILWLRQLAGWGDHPSIPPFKAFIWSWWSFMSGILLLTNIIHANKHIEGNIVLIASILIPLPFAIYGWSLTIRAGRTPRHYQYTGNCHRLVRMGSSRYINVINTNANKWFVAHSELGDSILVGSDVKIDAFIGTDGLADIIRM